MVAKPLVIDGANNMKRNHFPLVLPALAILLAGCGGDGLKDVSGTVSLKGKAVPKGMVWFDPASSHPATGHTPRALSTFSNAKSGISSFPTVCAARPVVNG